MQRKKLVSINFYDIFPMTNGGQLSVFGLCRGLSEYFDVTLVMFCGADIYKDEIQVSENFVIIPIDRPRELVREEALFARKMELPHTSPITADTMWAKDDYMVSRLKDVTELADIILIDHPYTYAIAKAASPDKIFWHRANNVEADYMTLAYAEYDECAQLVESIKNIEKKCCLGCDQIFTVTEADRLRLCDVYQLPPDKVTNASVGADIENATFVLPSARENDKILYLSGNYPAAREAVSRIVDAARKLRSYEFFIAGLVCSECADKDDLPPNLHLLWVVSESKKRELLQSCALALNPVLSGAGINMKLVEDFAFGIPVLTTAHGARGINVSDGVEVVIENGSDLANAILGFFKTDIEFRDRLASNARRMVERDWLWSSVAKRMIEAAKMPLPSKTQQHISTFIAENTPDFENKTLFMWGAGEQGLFCLNEMKNRGMQNIRIVDSAPNKIGTTFENILVESPNVMYNSQNAICVISVGALTDAAEIYRVCLENAVNPENLIIARGPLFNPSFLDEEKLRGG